LPGDAASDSFSSEDAREAEQQHRLDLYGFADLTYTRLLSPIQRLEPHLLAAPRRSVAGRNRVRAASANHLRRKSRQSERQAAQ
jgi:hypothetical protein